MVRNQLKEENEPTEIPKTGRFDDLDSAVIISNVAQNLTAESMLSKHPVLRITVVLVFLNNSWLLEVSCCTS